MKWDFESQYNIFYETAIDVLTLNLLCGIVLLPICV